MIGRRSHSGPPQVALAPEGTRGWIADAIVAGGGELVELADAEALVWATPSEPEELAATVAEAPNVHWVQLPWAGIEPFASVLDGDHLWTCGKGVYAEPVAEHALMLALAGMRGLGSYARASEWTGPQGVNLLGAHVVILGGGGITDSLLRLLEPFGCHVTVVRRSQAPTLADLDDLLPTADLVVLALALTPATDHVIDERRLGLMHSSAWIVNVARGRHIDTTALVAALAQRRIGGAALDVTDPEPLPDDHPLWALDNCIITPHVGNTPEMAQPLLSARITENIRRFGAGEELVGVVDTDAGY